MSRPTPAELGRVPHDPDTVVKVGGWLFKHRTSLPLPIVAALVLIPPSAPPSLRTWLVAAGVLTIGTGEALRFWGVHHIGTISRTRSDRLGPLVDTGPFSMVRNPLYLGNILLWVGFALAAGLPWLAPIVAAVLALEYHAIVRWEERLLESRLGDAYRRYQREVSRWIPRWPTASPTVANAAFSWGETAFSERGTLVAIATGFALLALKGLVI
jgi:protein-S-isoprenylcysteine O-methyltransferase Ste14